MALSDKEKLLKLQQKQEQLKQQEKELKKRIAKNNRKADTHRKIQVGAAVESVCHIKIDGKDDINKLIAFLEGQETRGKYFSKAMGYSYREFIDSDGKKQIEYFKDETTQAEVKPEKVTEIYPQQPLTTEDTSKVMEENTNLF